MSLSRSKADSGMYYGKVGNAWVLIALYVDDLAIASDDLKTLHWIKLKLSERFKMKDMNEMKHILGIDIYYNRQDGKMILSQKTFAEHILKRFGMNEAKSIPTPMDHRMILQKAENDKNVLRNIPYRSIIGNLMYLMICTRPDLAFAVGILSQFSEHPSNEHWIAFKRVLRYLKGTQDFCLLYKKSANATLVGYSDASWGNSQDRKSMSGFGMFYGDAIVSWSSRKQPIIALSTTEADTIAMSNAVREVIWLKKLFTEINDQKPSSTTIYVDNQSSIALAKQEGNHGRTKHIDIKYLRIQECIEKNIKTVQYCPTEEMTADIFTKALPRSKHDKCVASLLISRPSN
jgi:Reverse transcriptase (RNA-dependent DNA polymerase)